MISYQEGEIPRPEVSELWKCWDGRNQLCCNSEQEVTLSGQDFYLSSLKRKPAVSGLCFIAYYTLVWAETWGLWRYSKHTALRQRFY